MYGILKYWLCRDSDKHWKKNEHGPVGVNTYDCSKYLPFGAEAYSTPIPQLI